MTTTEMQSPPSFTTEEALEYIHNTVEYAESKFPIFSCHPAHGATILVEEVGKYSRAINRLINSHGDTEQNLRDLQEYAASIGAVSVRILKNMKTFSYLS